MKTSYGKQFMITIIIVFLLLSSIILYTVTVNYKESLNHVEAIGENSLKYESERIDRHLQMSYDTIQNVSNSVNYMMKLGRTNKEISDYLLMETKHLPNQTDRDFTIIYGYINDEFMSSDSWNPSDDYDPTKRDWYINAVKNNGKPVLSSPFINANTGTKIVTISKLLNDNKSVISINMELRKIQEITEKINVEKLGYAFLIDDNGVIVAHHDKNKNGEKFTNEKDSKEILKKIKSVKTGCFHTTYEGRKCTIFIDTVMDNWHIMMIVKDKNLYKEVYDKLFIEAVIYLIIFITITVFCFISYKKALESHKKELKSQIELKHLNNMIINALAYAIDTKDRYTSGHSKRVADYALMIAKKLNLSYQERETIYNAGLLHDVGKIRISEAVINKPGKLNQEEFEQIMAHPVCSYHLLKNIYEKDNEICYGAKFHHERYDGTGYPNGLKGTNIPKIARIIAVADAYDAMASNRSYRNALEQDIIKNEIIKGKGTQFDPEFADVMLEIINEDKNYELRQHDNVKHNITIIEDNDKSLSRVSDIIDSTGEYAITRVLKYENIAHILKNNSIDLIIIDFDAFTKEEIKGYSKIAYDRNIPMILVGKEIADTNLENLSKLHIDDFITKPAKEFSLKEIVHAILSNWNAG